MSELTPPGPPEPAPPGYPPPPPGPPPGYPPPPPAWGLPTYAPPPQRNPNYTRNMVALIAGAVAAAVVAVVIVALFDNPSPPAGNNGESTKTAAAIVTDAAAAFDGARSLHLTGTGRNPSETDVFDLVVTTAGTQGSINANGTHADVVVIGDDAYLRGRDFFSKFAGPEAGAAIGDRWVHAKTTDPTYGKYFAFMTMDGLRSSLDGLAKQPNFAKGNPTRLDGALVVPLHALDGELDVALDGTPYATRLQVTFGGGQSADLHFSGFDAPAPQPTAPAGALDVPAPPAA